MRSCLLNRKRVYQNPCSFLLVTYLKSTRFILNIPKYLESYFFSFSNYTHEFEKKKTLNLEIISDLQKKNAEIMLSAKHLLQLPQCSALMPPCL